MKPSCKPPPVVGYLFLLLDSIGAVAPLADRPGALAARVVPALSTSVQVQGHASPVIEMMAAAGGGRGGGSLFCRSPDGTAS